MARYILMEPAFIGGALLAAGSIIVDEDLPEAPPRDPATQRIVTDDKGKPADPIKSAPPMSAIEVDDNNWPVNEADVEVLANAGVSALPIEIGSINPHAPNPTMPQGFPSRLPGEVLTPGRYVPQQNQGGGDAATTAAGTASADGVEEVKRRSTTAKSTADE